MKFLIIFIILVFYISLAFASPKEILKCLGKEEQFIHENKIGGAFYKLNQELISNFILLPQEISLNDQLYKSICNRKINFPSFKLLEKLILKENIFTLNIEAGDISKKALVEVSIGEMQESAIDIFMNFLNNIQSQTSDAKCLTAQISDLTELFEKFRYIEEDVGKVAILQELKEKKNIFDQLENASNFLKKCNQVKEPKKP